MESLSSFCSNPPRSRRHDGALVSHVQYSITWGLVMRSDAKTTWTRSASIARLYFCFEYRQ